MKSLLKLKVLNFVLRVVLPPFWIQVERTDWNWDAVLRAILSDNPEIKKLDRYSHLVNGIKVWTENYPYAYGNRYPKKTGIPSVLTRIKLKNAIKMAGE